MREPFLAAKTITTCVFDLYSWNTPNGQKAVIALEESGADYNYHPIDISNGEQHSPDFRSLSPFGKIPALISHTTPTVTHFESGAILLHLAELFPLLHGATPNERAKVISWTFWQTSQFGPFAGQFGYFSGGNNADPDTIKHFQQLLIRCLDTLEQRLTETPYLAGDRFTVADIASLPWVASKQSYLQRYNVAWRERCPVLQTWADNALKRPSVVKAFSLPK